MNLLKLLTKHKDKKKPQPPQHAELTSLSKEVIDFYRNSDYKAVVKGCDQIIAVDPTNQEAYRIRGYAKYKLGDVDGASDDVRTANWLPKL